MILNVMAGLVSKISKKILVLGPPTCKPLFFLYYYPTQSNLDFKSLKLIQEAFKSLERYQNIGHF